MNDIKCIKIVVNISTNTMPLEELESNKELYKSIVEYFNTQAGKNYKSNTRKTQDLINARIKEGFKIDDFKKVIDTKVKAWKDDDKMNHYLRPNTLFGTKFKSYLNEDTDNEYNEIIF